MAAEDDDKTELPTAKKKTESRKKGQVAKSQDLNTAIVLMISLVLFNIYGQSFFKQMVDAVRVILLEMSIFNPSVDSCTYYYLVGINFLVNLLWPIMLTIVVAGLIINILQIGFVVSGESIQPKFSKINPISGMKKFISIKSFVDLVKNLIKLVIITIVTYQVLEPKYQMFLNMAELTVYRIVEVMFSVIYEVGMKIALVLLIMAIIDYMYQRFEHTKSIKMSKHEIKEEGKQMEGDPEVKARIKKIQRELAQQRMMGEVPKATVVITNPTYLAIAIKYEPSEMQAPIIVAKGKRNIAKKIKEVAKENDIPIVEDKPLARSMFDVVEIGDEIPAEFFKAVAEILAYIYRLKGKAAA